MHRNTIISLIKVLTSFNLIVSFTPWVLDPPLLTPRRIISYLFKIRDTNPMSNVIDNPILRIFSSVILCSIFSDKRNLSSIKRKHLEKEQIKLRRNETQDLIYHNKILSHFLHIPSLI